MPLAVPDAGELALLELLVKTALAAPDDWWLRLYVDDIDIEAATVIADVTEPTVPGYAAVELLRSLWNAPATIAGRGVVTWGTGPVWFTLTSGSEDIYGWYVTNAANDTLLFGSRLSSPPWVMTPANPLPLTPTMRLTTEFPPLV